MEINKVYLGDSLETIKTFPDESIDCVVTSPPYYGLRDYGIEGQIGLEETPEQYIQRLVELFREIRRCLKKEGTIWINIGDSYAGSGKGAANYPDNAKKYKQGTSKGMLGTPSVMIKTVGDDIKPKDLIGIPWMLAFALRADGWYLRQDIIWHKPNPMPESVTDRCTKSHEYIFLLSKSEKYYFDHEAIQEDAVTQFDALKTSSRFGGNKYGDNPDPHFATKSGKEWEPQTKARTKNCQYDGQRPNSFHLMRENGEEWQPQMRWGSGTKKERTHKQGYSQKENGGHRDNSGGFDSEMTIKDGVVVRNKRDVWTVNVRPNKEAHFATYPEMLIQPCILAGCPEKGVVLDPFMGSGTTGIVARKLNRNYVGCELNPEYQKMAERRILEQGENLFNQ